MPSTVHMFAQGTLSIVDSDGANGSKTVILPVGLAKRIPLAFGAINEALEASVSLSPIHLGAQSDHSAVKPGDVVALFDYLSSPQLWSGPSYDSIVRLKESGCSIVIAPGIGFSEDGQKSFNKVLALANVVLCNDVQFRRVFGITDTRTRSHVPEIARKHETDVVVTLGINGYCQAGLSGNVTNPVSRDAGKYGSFEHAKVSGNFAIFAGAFLTFYARDRDLSFAALQANRIASESPGCSFAEKISNSKSAAERIVQRSNFPMVGASPFDW